MKEGHQGKHPKPSQEKKIKNTYKYKVMKTQNTFFLQQLGQEQLNNLVKEVKETVATNVNLQNNKTVFGAVDYYKIQRSRRNRIVRRHLVA